ncbi:hypothetical protein VSPL_39730 [Vibrio splendidus]|nr:hypothetical protein VSPL_39730 [Vibrio splendidus]
MIREKSTKLSIIGKQKRCMMNTARLDTVLSAGFSQVVKKLGIHTVALYLRRIE